MNPSTKNTSCQAIAMQKFSFRRTLLCGLFSFMLLSFSTVFTPAYAETTTYDFSNSASLSTDWTVYVDTSSYKVSIETTAFQGIPVTDRGGILAFSLTSPSNKTIKVTSKKQFTNIKSISLEGSATDNSNPKIGINIVDQTAKQVVQILSSSNFKSAFSTKSTKTWGKYSKDLTETKSGYIEFTLTSSSTNKYGAIDSIVITTDDGSTSSTYSLTYDANIPDPWSLKTSLPYSVADLPAEVSDITSTTVSATEPTLKTTDGKAIYTFAGWNTSADGKGTKYTAGSTISLTANTTLYAQWTASTWNITYLDADKTTALSGLTPAEYAYDTESKLPTPTKDGYTLVAWYNLTGDAKLTSTKTLYGALSVYAEWKAVATYTVTYNAQEGTCETASATYTEGDAALTLPTPTREGYTFAGWYTAATDGTLVGAAGASYTPTASITLYARWTENTTPSTFTCGEMMRATVNTDGASVTASGDLAGTATCSGIKDTKLNAEGSYIALTLKEGESFKSGDSIVIYPTTQTNLEIFADKGKNSWGSLDKTSVKANAENKIALPDAAVGQNTVYLYRTKNNSVNPKLSYIALIRPCATYSLSWSASAWTYSEDGSQPTLTKTNIPDDAEIDYESSNEQVATISDDGTITKVGPGTTTITASYLSDDEKETLASASYTLTVVCADPQPKLKGVGVIAGCNEKITLQVVQSDGTAYMGDTYTFRWYKDGKAIANATTDTYTTDVVGKYYVVVTGECTIHSDTATITSTVNTPTVNRLTRFQYYRVGHTYSSVSNARHLFAYKSAEAGNERNAQLSATIISGTTRTELTDLSFLTTSATANAAGLYEVSTTCNESLRTLDSKLQSGDTLRIKLTPYDYCNELAPDYADSIDIYIVSKPSLAFIVSGANEYTREQSKYVAGGDFIDGVNPANLCIQSGKAWADADKATVLPLYQTLCDSFVTVPVNGYADFDSLNYEPFDLVFLTDFVKTDISSKGSKQRTKGNAAINNLGRLVDYRPMFSTKGFMAKEDFTIWKDKGFFGNPYDVKRKCEMTVLCYAHDIFTGLPELPTGKTPAHDDSCIYVLRDADENIVIRTLSQKGFDSDKGMQGFSEVDKNSFINITTIHGSVTLNKTTVDTTLISCAERQTNIDARLMVLCINADATSFITPIGCKAIVRALNYLLVTDPAHVSDCSLTFDNKNGGDHKWSNPKNWNSGHLPLSRQNVQIIEDCVVDSKTAHAANIKILKGKTLTIADTAALTAIGKVNTLLSTTESSKTEDLTDPNTITILSSEKGNGAFIHTAKSGESLPATVQLYSKSYREQGEDGKYTYYWQYVGIPTQEAQIPDCFFGAYTYVWKESLPSKWERRDDYTKIYGFEGVGLSDGISQNEKKTYTLQGNLNTTETKNIAVTAQSESYKGLNIIGNSWTAPLQVGNFTAADFGSAIDPYICIYNSGKDDREGNPTKGDYTNTAPGTWTTLTPSLVIQDTYTGPTVIPAMQGFYVHATKDTTLTLDYARLVHGTPAKDINTPLRAPAQDIESAEELEGDDAWAHVGETFGRFERSYKQVSTMRVTLSDSRSEASLYLMEDDMFSSALDRGYDAPQLYFNDRNYAPTLFALSELGNMAVLAVSDLENTHLAYRRGSQTTCTFSFGYNGDRLFYLNDALLGRSTLINNYNTYSFAVADTTVRNRFYISAVPINDKTTTSLVEVVTYADRLQLSNPAGEQLTIDIYDAAGRVVMQRRSSENLIRIETPAANGVYLIHAHGEQTNLLHKIVR